MKSANKSQKEQFYDSDEESFSSSSEGVPIQFSLSPLKDDSAKKKLPFEEEKSLKVIPMK